MVFSGAGAVFIDRRRGQLGFTVVKGSWFGAVGIMSDDNPTMNGHENHDEKLSHENKTKVSKQKIFQFSI